VSRIIVDPQEAVMVISTPSSPHSDDMSLAAAIGDAGRRTSSRNLSLILCGGVIGAVAIALLWHGHREMVVPFVMPVTFGIWGLAEHGERALETYGPESRVERTLLRGVRAAMVALGAAAAVATLFAITFTFAGQSGLQLR
jgi:hypothetical protein